MVTITAYPIPKPLDIQEEATNMVENIPKTRRGGEIAGKGTRRGKDEELDIQQPYTPC